MNLQNVLNTIRDNASVIYQDRVPEATQMNIQDIQAVMSDPNNAVVANEFMNTLLNMIIKQVIHQKLFSNPLKSLKKGNKPLGDTVEEIYTNFIKADVYDQTGAELLQRKLPDTKTVWHRMNRQDKYKVTVNPESLFKAFASYERLESYISSIINSLYNSSELDEFVLTKQLFKQALDNNAMVVVDIADPCTSEQNAKDFIKTVKIVSGDMAFPNENNNAYLTAQSDDTKPIVTFSRKDEQVLILDNATNVSVNIDVLASLFNEVYKVWEFKFEDTGILKLKKLEEVGFYNIKVEYETAPSGLVGTVTRQSIPENATVGTDYEIIIFIGK